jgi:predicted HTH domain antitoxin
METLLEIPIDDTILLALKKKKEEFIDEMLFNNAICLYKKNKLSLSKAAELVKLDRIGFINKMQAFGEVIFDFDDDEIEEIHINTEKVLKMME